MRIINGKELRLIEMSRKSNKKIREWIEYEDFVNNRNATFIEIVVMFLFALAQILVIEKYYLGVINNMNSKFITIYIAFGVVTVSICIAYIAFRVLRKEKYLEEDVVFIRDLK
jgi:uncharacterized membrane protein (DUF485 family)